MREEVGTKACIVAKIVKSRMKWAGHNGQNEIWSITETIRYKEARRLQKTRKTTAKMGGLSKEIYQKGRGGRKVQRKGQQQGPMETITKIA